MDHAMTVRAYNGQVLQARPFVLGELGQGQCVMALCESLPESTIHIAEIESTHFTLKPSGHLENLLLFLLYSRWISLPGFVYTRQQATLAVWLMTSAATNVTRLKTFDVKRRQTSQATRS
jgi:hypothetical protein